MAVQLSSIDRSRLDRESVGRVVCEWLSEVLTSTHFWREEKAEEYPDDSRNSRSAEALWEAVMYVHSPLMRSKALPKFIVLYTTCLRSDIDLTARDFRGRESERVAAQYFFDRGTGAADDETREQLLGDLYEATLEDLQHYDVYPGSPLGHLLGKVAPEPEAESSGESEANVVALLTEIRDLLRDRLPERT